MAVDGHSGQTLLDVLRGSSHVDIDSLDSKSARTLGPFVDSTSNQAIAFAELSLKHREDVLKKAAAFAEQEQAKYPDVTIQELAVEVAMVMLSLEMRSSLTGKVHIEANPNHAYSTSRTVACGKRFLKLASSLDPSFTSENLSVKIASTFEGLIACKELQHAGIHTLATTLFTIEQAALAAEAGCSYIAPYVNELKVHFEPGYTDPAPNLQLCVDIQQYYHEHGFGTQVLPASLTSPQEVMALAGVNHITVPPALIQALARIPATPDATKKYPSLFQKITQFPEPSQSTLSTKSAGVASSSRASPCSSASRASSSRASRSSHASSTSTPTRTPRNYGFLYNEPGFRLAMTRADAGRQEKKLVDAINIFCDKQEQLEKLIAPYLTVYTKTGAKTGPSCSPVA